jgi:hypothetical protein
MNIVENVKMNIILTESQIEFIRRYEKIRELVDNKNCNEGFDDEDYNLQESDNHKEYYSSLKNALIRRYDVIMNEMHHFIESNLDCEDYDELDEYMDYILEEVTDSLMFNHNLKSWEWSDLNDELKNMIGEQIKNTYTSWAKKHC